MTAVPLPDDESEPAKRRGPKRSLTHDQIIDCALAVLDDDGINAVTLRRLATELGVNQMTPYSYFASKDDLLEALAGRVLNQVTTAAELHAPWHEQAECLLRAMHDALRARPGIAELLLTRHLRGPHLDDIRERVLALILTAGLDANQSIDATRLLLNYTLASAIAETGRVEHYGRRPTRALDPDRYPVLAQLGSEYIDRGSGAAFAFGLTQIISSIRSLTTD